MSSGFTAQQIQTAILDSVRDGANDSITESLLKLLAIEYPADAEEFIAVIQFVRGKDSGYTLDDVWKEQNPDE